MLVGGYNALTVPCCKGILYHYAITVLGTIGGGGGGGGGAYKQHQGMLGGGEAGVKGNLCRGMCAFICGVRSRVGAGRVFVVVVVGGCWGGGRVACCRVDAVCRPRRETEGD